MKRKIVNQSGRMIGMLEGKTFLKKVSKEKHLFRVLDAWGSDYHVLYKELPPDGLIEVFDQDEQKLYRVTVAKFKELGAIKHFKTGTKDHNTQVFLSRKHWDTDEPEVLEVVSVKEPLVKQLPLL